MNGSAILEEIGAACVMLEQSHFDITGEPHRSNATCSPEEDVRQLEGTFKSTLDLLATVKMQEDVVKKLQNELVGGDDGEGLLDRFQQAFQKAKASYDKLDDGKRFASNAEYRSFRESIWDVRNPDVPFGNAPVQDNDDDELMVTGEHMNYKCPISLVVMTDPYTSSVCNHSFSKAIFDSLNQTGSIKCPIAGCMHRIRAADLRLDHALKRKIIRWKRNQEEQEDMDDVL